MSQRIDAEWEKFGKWNSIKIEASIEKFEIEPNSETEFITEHYWGYAKVNDQKSNEYEVTHPKWKIYKVNNFEIKVDFGTVYGKEFEFLNEVIPNSVTADSAGIPNSRFLFFSFLFSSFILDNKSVTFSLP